MKEQQIYHYDMYSTERTIRSLLYSLFLSVLVAGGALPLGREAKKEEFPFQVSVRQRAPSGVFAHRCSGALVDPSHVLTAAICVTGCTPDELQVVAGTTNMFGRDGREERKVTRVEEHPLFNEDDLTNNVALLQVGKPFPSNSAVKPAPMKSLSKTNKCTITGWTIIFKSAPPNFQVLRTLHGNPISRKDCFKNLQQSGFSYNNGTICVHFDGAGNDEVCSVDNGSLLLCDGALLGIASSGQACSKTSVPFLFSNITIYGDWVRSNIKGSIETKS